MSYTETRLGGTDVEGKKKQQEYDDTSIDAIRSRIIKKTCHVVLQS